MQQPDMRIEPLDHLAIHLHDQTQDAVGRRMLRPEVHGHGLDLGFDGGHQAPSSFAFSSPGNERGNPSQGLRKSKLRYRSEEHTSELQSLMRLSYAAICLKKKTTYKTQ